MNKLQIINHALMKAGLPLAASLNDCDWNALSIYEWVVSQCLRSFTWGFAQRFKTLERQEASPEFGFNYAYALPPACVRAIDVHTASDIRSPKATFEVCGGLLYTSVAPCHLRYIADDIPPENWPPDFANAVASLIAAEIAALSTQSAANTAALLQLHNAAMAQAQAVDAFERTERVRLPENIFRSNNK